MSEINPVWVLVVLAVLTTAVGGTWKWSKWVHKVNDETGRWPALVGEIRKDIGEIRADIKKIFLGLPPQPVASGSPLRLTEFGEELAKSLNAKLWAAELAPTLLSGIEGFKPFQVDEFSAKYVQEDLSKGMEERVSACAYEAGIKREGVLDVLRVVLRDELLSRRGSEC